MNWLQQNSQWIIPIITSLIGVIIGKLWDAATKKKQHDIERKENYAAENSRLKNELFKITDFNEKRAKYTYSSSGFYFLKDGSSEQKICSRCFDSEGKEINLIVTDNNHFKCPNCHSAGWIRGCPDVNGDYEAQTSNLIKW